MKVLQLILVALIVFQSPLVSAEEYFGEFKDELKGQFLDTEPRPIFKLESKFDFLDPNGLLWNVPPAVEVDGASIPPPFWSVIGGPFSGGYIKASVIHDHFCDTKSRTQHDTHRNFYYGMRASGVSLWKAKFMYWAVATFGPKWKIEKRIAQNLKCDKRFIGKDLVCESEPKLVDEVVLVEGIDLSDPENLAAALSKASAVAKTLKSSDGAVLDITPLGQTAASLDDIAASSDKYRQIFATKSFRERPAELGVLSNWDVAGLNAIEGWKGNQLPTYDNAIYLRESTGPSIANGQQFKLEREHINLLSEQLDLNSIQVRMELPRQECWRPTNRCR